MSKSILHNKNDGTCYLCMLLYSDYSRKQTEEHHVMSGHGNRKLAEHYGLKVYLCIPHHRTSRGAVHHNINTARALRMIAQAEFEKRYSHEKWMQTFGRNYIDRESSEQADPFGEDISRSNKSTKPPGGITFFPSEGGTDGNEST